jgi:phage shock protein A
MSDVIDFTAKAKETVMTPVKSYSRGCSHTAITLDEHRRKIECKNCGKVIEAFDYLFDFANGQQRIVWRLKSVEDEVKQLEEKVGELKRVKSNLQAQVRRLNSKV